MSIGKFIAVVERLLNMLVNDECEFCDVLLSRDKKKEQNI